MMVMFFFIAQKKFLNFMRNPKLAHILTDKLTIVVGIIGLMVL